MINLIIIHNMHILTTIRYDFAPTPLKSLTSGTSKFVGPQQPSPTPDGKLNHLFGKVNNNIARLKIPSTHSTHNAEIALQVILQELQNF